MKESPEARQNRLNKLRLKAESEVNRVISFLNSPRNHEARQWLEVNLPKPPPKRKAFR